MKEETTTESNNRSRIGSTDNDFDERRRKRSRSRSRSPYRRSGGKRSSSDRHGSEHNDRMVYISNIPYDVRWMEIKDLVREKAGEVVFVEVLEDRNGRSKGAAVVEFRDKDSVAKCVEALNRYPMNNRLVVAKEIRDPNAFFRKVKEDTGVDFLDPRGGIRPVIGMGIRDRDRNSGGGPPDRPPASGTYDTFGLSPVFLRQLGVDGPLCNRVFVANLPYNIQSGRVWDIFALAGKVTWVDLQLDKEGKSKGLAVVEYSHPIEAVQAISMLNNQRIHDRSITVKMDKYEKPVEKRPGDLPQGLRGVGMGLGANGAPLTDIASVINSVNSPPSNQMANTNNMPTHGVGAMNMMGAGNYGSFGGQATIPQPQPQQTTPFSSYVGGGGATGALPQSNAQLYGMAGYVGATQQPQQQPQQQQQQQQQQSYASNTGYGVSGGVVGGGASLDGGYNRMTDYGAADHRTAATDSFRQSRTIVIKNLPGDYTWQIVRDRARHFGDVEFADCMSTGCFKVRFKLVADAERARGALQGTTVEGRVITVDFYYD